jgi:hypothetical protein
VAGQRPTSNSTTLDGLTFGGASVPQDAVRNTRVITNSYDVARGQFSGGQVATTTKSGTNSVQGTANYSLRDRDLSVSVGDTSAFTQGFTQHQLSAGVGGPLAKNKIFYFGSMSGRLRDDGLQSLLSATPSSLTRLGLAPDSAQRFLGFLSAPQLAPRRRGRGHRSHHQRRERAGPDGFHSRAEPDADAAGRLAPEPERADRRGTALGARRGRYRRARRAAAGWPRCPRDSAPRS